MLLLLSILTLSNIITYFLYHFLLVPTNTEYLKTVLFVLVIAAFVQLLEIILKRYFKSIHKMLGIYLPLITTNCAVFGIILTNIKADYNLIEATLDKSEKDKNLIDFLTEIANQFGIKDFDTIKRAQKAGFVVQNNFNVMMQNGLDFDEALKNARAARVIIPPKKEQKPISVALIGHGYNIYDERASMKIFEKLEKMEKDGKRGMVMYSAELSKIVEEFQLENMPLILSQFPH